jgi:hypothetical protein
MDLLHVLPQEPGKLFVVMRLCSRSGLGLSLVLSCFDLDSLQHAAS